MRFADDEEVITLIQLLSKMSSEFTVTCYNDFIDKLPHTIRNRQKELLENPRAYDQFVEDPIMTLFRYEHI